MDLFSKLGVWKRGTQRAPHKPLLLLLALARKQDGKGGAILFEEVEPKLRELLQEFGPTRSSYYPEYPFWHLQTDGLWTVSSEKEVLLRPGSSNPSKGELISKKARGAFSSEVNAYFDSHPDSIQRVARELLSAHFPPSIHDDISASVGLSLDEKQSEANRRDPKFRNRLLVAYEYKCAICGLDIRIGSVSVGLDAAHIKWFQAGGPDVTQNGIILCSLHHKLFDLGAFSIKHDMRMIVSEQTHGTLAFEEVLLRHHGQAVRRPQRDEQMPDPTFLDWHFDEVFKKAARPL